MLQEKITLCDIRGDLAIYFNWSANALMPVNPGAADRFLRVNKNVIYKTAQELLNQVRCANDIIYRGILLKERVEKILPLKNMEYLSFSSDRSVAEHFADTKGFGSEIMDLASRLGSNGYIIEYTPKVTEILFHHQFLSILPYAEAFSLMGIDGIREVESLKQQKEIMIFQPAEPFTKFTRKYCLNYAK